MDASIGRERERERDLQGAAMLNANWRKLAQDVKLHKTVSQWQAIARTSQPGSKGSGRENKREREGEIGGRVSRRKEKGEEG